jgi:hypothetical protein
MRYDPPTLDEAASAFKVSDIKLKAREFPEDGDYFSLIYGIWIDGKGDQWAYNRSYVVLYHRKAGERYGVALAKSRWVNDIVSTIHIWVDTRPNRDGTGERFATLREITEWFRGYNFGEAPP